MTEAKEPVKVEAKTIFEAFLEAYAEMPDPKKNAENPAFKRDGKPMKYADLEAFLDVAKPILVAVGFALVQEPVNEGDRVGVHTYLQYKTGEVMDFGSFTVALSKPDPQGAGAALTYCRRYAVAAIFGLAQEDDDANRASVKTEESTTSTHTALASDKQIGLIFGLSRDVGWDDAKLLNTIKKSFPGKDHPGDLTGGREGEASKLIDYLSGKKKELAAKEGAVVADLTGEEVPAADEDAGYDDGGIPF